MKLSQTKRINQQELEELQEAHKKQSDEVLKAYLRAKMVLEQRGLPVVPAVTKPGPKPRRKIDMTLAAFALNHGLLDNLSGKEITVYRTLLQGLPFQYRMRDVLAEEAGVSVSTVRQAIIKLEAIGLIAKHRVPNRSCVLAFTDTRELSAPQIEQMKQKYPSQLIEKVSKRPVIRKQQRTAPQFFAGSITSSKSKEDCSASPRVSPTSGGRSTTYDQLHESQSGSGEFNRYGVNSDVPEQSGMRTSHLPEQVDMFTSMLDSHGQPDMFNPEHGDRGFTPDQPDMFNPDHGDRGFTPDQPDMFNPEHGDRGFTPDQPDMFNPDHGDRGFTSDQPDMFNPDHDDRGFTPDQPDMFNPDQPDTFASTAPASPQAEAGVQIKVKSGDSNLSGFESLAQHLSSKTGYSYDVPPMAVWNENPFYHLPLQQRKQEQRCQHPEIMKLQDLIESQLRSGIKAKDICRELHHRGFLLPGIFREIQPGGDFFAQTTEMRKHLAPHFECNVMCSILSEIAVLRGDHPGQIQTWIAHSDLRATSKWGLGGLLANVMLKAERVDTAALYPEAAAALSTFLDEVGIGVALPTPEDFGLTLEDLEAFMNVPLESERPDMRLIEDERLGKISRMSLLRDYCGVVQALAVDMSDGDDIEWNEVPDVLMSQYMEGDANGIPVRDQADGPVKFLMAKLALNRIVDTIQSPIATGIYLPHQIHGTRRQAKKQLEAAQNAA